MKILKKILIVLISLCALWLVLALFISGEYEVKRDVLIERNSDEVFEYLVYLKNQDNFSAWAQMDPDMKKTYTGTDGQVGFISAWESKNEDVGVGEQEIMSITDGKRIDYELRFKVPFESTDDAYMLTDGLDENSTRVTWGFKGKIPYPFNVMKPFMNFDEMLGPDLEKGLKNLRELLENTED